MGLLRKLAYMGYLNTQPWTVVMYNGKALFSRFMALTTTAIIMWWTYIPFVFYKIFRGRSFDFDFDELDDEGKKYS